MSRAWTGGPAGSRAVCVLAPNPGPMTLEGTNTWVLAEPGSREAVVVDPGPLDEGHLNTVLDLAVAGGRRVALTLLTHGHLDHTEGAARFAELSGATTLGAGYGGLADRSPIGPPELGLRVLAVPGHTADSVAFLLPGDHSLLTGDTVLGRGTSVVAHPDGALGPYLASLRRIESLTATGQVRMMLPGHGPVVPDAAAKVREYLVHREERLDQVRRVLAIGACDTRVAADVADTVLRAVYADVPREVWPAARQSVLAQLDYLREHG